MTETVIKVDNLGKRYNISHKSPERYTALRDIITNKAKSFTRSIITPLKNKKINPAKEEFWALKDVSFEVKRGEVIGIIGRNGAGKTTLLKLLSRITEPSTGSFTIKGRVASLLEVGTGFHPELTGRENIFLNGAILGMSRQEIKQKFDEIVAFAEIHKFLDTPVKRYSSGMYVRLAFSVAAHLEPEILLIDEVLAVGDAEFQKKCLGKMNQEAKTGRTILFVSHNMSAVRSICERALFFSSGRLSMDDVVIPVINKYLFNNNDTDQFSPSISFDKGRLVGNSDIRINKIELISESGGLKTSFAINETFKINIYYEILNTIPNFHFYGKIYNEEGMLAFCSADWDEGEVSNSEKKIGKYQTSICIPQNLLNHGKYYLHLSGLIPSIRFLFQEADIIGWEILAKGGAGGVESVNRPGIVRPILEWRSTNFR